MPLPVLGSVSEAEAIGLGKLLEVHAQKQTGTLFSGIDIAPDDDTTAARVKSIFVHRIGELLRSFTTCCWYMMMLRTMHHARAVASDSFPMNAAAA